MAHNQTPESYLNKDFNSIYVELLDTVKRLSSKWDPTITNESDPGIVLLKANAIIADKNNYNIDKNILELFPDTVSEDHNARSMYKQLGYKMSWCKSASDIILVKWVGDDLSAGQSITIPRYTMFCDSEEEFVYTLTTEIILDKEHPSALGTVVEGIYTNASINGNTIITYDYIDRNNRLYLPDYMIAQNAIFVSSIDAPDVLWTQVDNVLLESPDKKSYEFVVDTLNSVCYLQFSSNIHNLIGQGINVSYLLSNGEAGNIPAKTLSQLYKQLSVTVGDSTIPLGEDNIQCYNPYNITSGKDPESLEDAYTNYRRTCGTFDTLVTVRDYLNALLRMDEVGNGFVCDRNNDPQCSYTVLTSDEINPEELVVTSTASGVGTLTQDVNGIEPIHFIYIPVDGTEEYLNSETNVWETTRTDKTTKVKYSFNKNSVDLTAFDLKLYLLQSVSVIDSPETYDATFNPIKADKSTGVSSTRLYRTILNRLNSLKGVQHDLVDHKLDIPFMFKNYYPLQIRIVPHRKLDALEQREVSNAVIDQLQQNLNGQKVSFGSEVTYDTVLPLLENADPRIKTVILDDLSYYTYYCYWSNDVNTVIEKPLLSHSIHNKNQLRNCVTTAKTTPDEDILATASDYVTVKKQEIEGAPTQFYLYRTDDKGARWYICSDTSRELHWKYNNGGTASGHRLSSYWDQNVAEAVIFRESSRKDALDDDITCIYTKINNKNYYLGSVHRQVSGKCQILYTDLCLMQNNGPIEPSGETPVLWNAARMCPHPKDASLGYIIYIRYPYSAIVNGGSTTNNFADDYTAMVGRAPVTEDGSGNPLFSYHFITEKDNGSIIFTTETEDSLACKIARKYVLESDAGFSVRRDICAKSVLKGVTPWYEPTTLHKRSILDQNLGAATPKFISTYMELNPFSTDLQPEVREIECTEHPENTKKAFFRYKFKRDTNNKKVRAQYTLKPGESIKFFGPSVKFDNSYCNYVKYEFVTSDSGNVEKQRVIRPYTPEDKKTAESIPLQVKHSDLVGCLESFLCQYTFDVCAVHSRHTALSVNNALANENAAWKEDYYISSTSDHYTISMPNLTRLYYDIQNVSDDVHLGILDNIYSFFEGVLKENNDGGATIRCKSPNGTPYYLDVINSGGQLKLHFSSDVGDARVFVYRTIESNELCIGIYFPTVSPVGPMYLVANEDGCSITPNLSECTLFSLSSGTNTMLKEITKSQYSVKYVQEKDTPVMTHTGVYHLAIQAFEALRTQIKQDGSTDLTLTDDMKYVTGKDSEGNSLTDEEYVGWTVYNAAEEVPYNYITSVARVYNLTMTTDSSTQLDNAFSRISAISSKCNEEGEVEYVDFEYKPNRPISESETRETAYMWIIDHAYERGAITMYESSPIVKIGANSIYQLKPSDELTFFWRSEDGEDAPYEYIKYKVDDKGNAPVIKTNFTIIGNVDTSRKIPSMPYEKGEVRVGDPAFSPISKLYGDYDLSGTKQIDVGSIREVSLDFEKKPRIYFTSSTVQNNKYKMKFYRSTNVTGNAPYTITYSRVLGEGETFICFNSTGSDFEILSGGSLVNVTYVYSTRPEVKDSVVLEVPYVDILQADASTLTDVHSKAITLSSESDISALSYAEQQIYSLVEGDTLDITLPDPEQEFVLNTITNTPINSDVNIRYIPSGTSEYTALPQIKLSGNRASWIGKAYLMLDTAPDAPQLVSVVDLSTEDTDRCKACRCVFYKEGDSYVSPLPDMYVYGDTATPGATIDDLKQKSAQFYIDCDVDLLRVGGLDMDVSYTNMYGNTYNPSIYIHRIDPDYTLVSEGGDWEYQPTGTVILRRTVNETVDEMLTFSSDGSPYYLWSVSATANKGGSASLTSTNSSLYRLSGNAEQLGSSSIMASKTFFRLKDKKSGCSLKLTLNPAESGELFTIVFHPVIPMKMNDGAIPKLHYITSYSGETNRFGVKNDVTTDVVKMNELDFFDYLKELDINNDFDYSAMSDESNRIYDPTVAESFFATNHPYNQNVIAQAVFHDVIDPENETVKTSILFVNNR